MVEFISEVVTDLCQIAGISEIARQQNLRDLAIAKIYEGAIIHFLEREQYKPLASDILPAVETEKVDQLKLQNFLKQYQNNSDFKESLGKSGAQVLSDFIGDLAELVDLDQSQVAELQRKYQTLVSGLESLTQMGITPTDNVSMSLEKIAGKR